MLLSEPKRKIVGALFYTIKSVMFRKLLLSVSILRLFWKGYLKRLGDSDLFSCGYDGFDSMGLLSNKQKMETQRDRVIINTVSMNWNESACFNKSFWLNIMDCHMMRMPACRARFAGIVSCSHVYRDSTHNQPFQCLLCYKIQKGHNNFSLDWLATQSGIEISITECIIKYKTNPYYFFIQFIICIWFSDLKKIKARNTIQIDFQQLHIDT